MEKRFIVTKSQLKRLVQKAVSVTDDWKLNAAGNGFTKTVINDDQKILECFVNRKTSNWSIIDKATDKILKQGKNKDFSKSKSVVDAELAKL